jgi:two-component system, response regulator PdtaR
LRSVRRLTRFVLNTGVIKECAVNISYRIAIADDDPKDRATLRDSLIRAGHQVIIEASSGEEILERCTASSGDSAQLLITDVEMTGVSGLEAAAKIVEHRDIPFIIVSGLDADQLIEQASAQHAFAYLVKPIRDSELKAAICIAVQRFQELESSRSETASMSQALVDRKIVERAKGILMRKRNLDESSAFNYLQHLARQHRQKLVDVAKSINLAEHALNDP